MHAPQLHVGPDQVLMSLLKISISTISFMFLGISLFQRAAPEYFMECSPNVVVFDLGCTNFEESLKAYGIFLASYRSCTEDGPIWFLHL